MPIRAIFAALVLTLLTAAAEERAPAPTAVGTPPAAVLKEPFYYDAENAQGTWGQSNGLGLVFRIEDGKEVCHILFFGEGRDIVKEEILPVAREKGTVTIGKVVCDWNPRASTLVLPQGHEIPVDKGVIVIALKESGRCRYLLTEFLTAKAQTDAEAKQTPKTEEEIWKRLCGLRYVRIRNGEGLMGAGEKLCFLEDKDGRKCRVITYGSGVPVVADQTVRMTLEGTKITIGAVTLEGTGIATGERIFRLDPVSMSITQEKPAQDKACFPD